MASKQTPINFTILGWSKLTIVAHSAIKESTSACVAIPERKIVYEFT